MKRALTAVIVMLLLLSLAACSGNDVQEQAENTSGENQTSESTEGSEEKETEHTGENGDMINMHMTINGKEVRVTWEDNESVRALAELAAESPVTIETSRYGGFEQVGPIGTTLPASDADTVTKPGEIALYTSNNIVVFFGSNSWAYTRLGHIEDLSDDELKELLGGSSAVITITAE